MLNDQWSVVYPGAEFTFGTGETPVFNITTPDLGDIDVRTSDTERARTDGVSFGTDFRGGRTIGFDLGIKGETEDVIRDAEAALSRTWRADVVRSTPGAVAELRSRYRDRERVVFGRPRRYAPDLSNAKFGLGLVSADFQCADDKWYSVDESVVSVNLVPAPGGGLVAPLASPLSTTESSDRSVGLRVTSDLPVWPTFEIHGPITNPVIEVVGVLRMELRTTLAYDETLVIDTAPWGRSVLVGGGSRAGALTRTSTRLSKASIPPGNYELALRGEDATGTASATVRWRDVYTTP